MKKQVETFFQEEVEIAFKTSEYYQRKQVGLLGGNFNPVHYGHLMMADQVFHQLGLDEVRLMPEFLPPHVDEKTTISADHRVRMLELATDDNPHLTVERIEVERGGKSYTIETILALKEQHPDTDYYFIIGGDMVAYLPKWYRIDELAGLVQFVGIRRAGFSVASPYPILWVDTPLIETSSSFIRQKIRQGCSVNYFLPPAVIDYIHEEGLYLA